MLAVVLAGVSCIVVAIIVVIIIVMKKSPKVSPVGPAVPSAPGAHRGVLLAQLPIADILKPGGGNWKFSKPVSWLGSSVVNYQGTQALKVHHDKGSGSTATDPSAIGGIGVFGVPNGLPASSGGVVFAYDVLYPPGWQWARGGKMGGVSIGTGKSSGGHHTADGASHRVMWQVNGGAISYIYVPEGAKQINPALQGSKIYGFGLFNADFAGALKIGTWNRIEVGTKLNTFDAAGAPIPNGWATLTVNGMTRAVNNVVWRSRPSDNINNVFFSDFFGGPENSPVDQSSYYANPALYAWKD